MLGVEKQIRPYNVEVAAVKEDTGWNVALGCIGLAERTDVGCVHECHSVCCVGGLVWCGGGKWQLLIVTSCLICPERQCGEAYLSSESSSQIGQERLLRTSLFG